MSRQINQPINQVRLTNVAVVRYQVGGKRFEIACYKNKVLDYRAGLETDLSEVLQTDRIFTNVSKGSFANTADLNRAFGADFVQKEGEEGIARIILQKGRSVQVSDLERAQQLESTLSQIATWVAANCVHRNTRRPFPVSQIKNALSGGGGGGNSSSSATSTAYQVQPHKALKRQYLDAVKFLKTVLPLERAKMEIWLEYPQEAHDTVMEVVERMEVDAASTTTNTTNTNTTANTTSMVLQIDPACYRDLNELTKTIPGARLEIRQQVVMNQHQQQDAANLSAPAVAAKYDGNHHQVDDDDDDDDEYDEEVAPLVEKIQAIRMQAQTNEDGTTNTSAPDTDTTPNPTMSAERADIDHDEDANSSNDDEDGDGDEDENKEEDDDDDEDELLMVSRKNRKKKLKKQQKKAKRRAREHFDDSDDEQEEDDQPAKYKGNGKKKCQNKAAKARTGPATVKPSHSEAATADVAVLTKTTISSTTTDDRDKKSCNTCGGSFSPSEYRAHFRSDWHRFNLKLKLRGAPTVSEQEFLLCDADTFFNNKDEDGSIL